MKNIYRTSYELVIRDIHKKSQNKEDDIPTVAIIALTLPSLANIIHLWVNSNI